MTDATKMGPTQLGRQFGLPDMPRRMRSVERRIGRVGRELAPVLSPAGRAAVLAPGKRLRPMLTIVGAALAGVFDRRVVDAAVAVELVQVGSLIHDDLIEGAALRRGVPTINAAEDAATAVVTGDLVLSTAAALVAGLGAAPAEMVSKGLIDMASGQLEEIRDLFKGDRTTERHMLAIQGKTGSLFACACRLGAWCGRLPEPQQDAMTRFGAAFGVGYQLVDDLLDVVGDPGRIGKPVGVDLATGVYTLPTILALRQRGGKTLARLLRRGGAGDLAQAAARIGASAAVAQTIDVIEQWMGEARRAAAQLPDSAVSRGLQAFPSAYAAWALDALVASS